MATAVTLTPDTPTPVFSAAAGGSYPKTGERRRLQRTLRLDALPTAMLDRVRSQRAAGRSWEEIEHDSMGWPEWDEVSEEVLSGFPDRRLPHTNLCRWYDLRVEQVRQRHEQIVLAAQTLGERLSGGGFPHLYAAIKNALAVMVFGLWDECPDQILVREELYRLAKVVIAIARLERAEERAERAKEVMGNQAAVSGQRGGAGYQLSALSQHEAVRHQVPTDSQNDSQGATAKSILAGENPRPPASSRVETAFRNQPSALSRPEAVSHRVSAASRNESQGATAKSILTGENPRPPASARVEAVFSNRPSASGQKEPINKLARGDEWAGTDPVAILKELGPDFEKLAATLVSTAPASAFVSNRVGT